MRRIRDFALVALEAATALYAVIALTLLLRAAKDSREEGESDYDRGRRDERRVLLAEARAAEQWARGSGDSESSGEEARLLALEKRVAQLERGAKEVRGFAPNSLARRLDVELYVEERFSELVSRTTRSEEFVDAFIRGIGPVCADGTDEADAVRAFVSRMLGSGFHGADAARLADLERRATQQDDYVAKHEHAPSTALESLRRRVVNLETVNEGWGELNARLNKAESGLDAQRGVVRRHDERLAKLEEAAE